MKNACLRGCALAGAAIATAVLRGALLVVSMAMPAGAQIVSDTFPRYECPAAGTEVVGSDGVRIRFSGTAAGIFTTCIVEGVGPRLIGLPPSIGEWWRLSPRNLESLLRAGTPYVLIGDKPNPCREVPASGPWPPPDIAQYIATLRHLSIPAVGLDVMILRYEELKRTCGFRTEFETSEFWIDVATRVPVRVSIHRSLGPPILPATFPREERIEWRAVAIERAP